MARELSRYEKQVSEFFRRNPETIKITRCLVCDSKTRFVWFKKDPNMTIVRCKCGFVYNATPPSQKVLDKFYSSAKAMDTWADFKSNKDNKRQQEKFGGAVASIWGSEYGSVLDIGCGNGTFLRLVENASPSCHLVGVEGNKAAREFGKKHGLEIYPTLPGGEFDVVSLWGVLEHLLDPKTMIKRVREYNPKLVIICVPNVISMVVETLQSECFTFCPQHIYYFTPRSMHTFLENQGLDPYRFNFIESEKNPIAKKQLGFSPYKDVPPHFQALFQDRVGDLYVPSHKHYKMVVYCR